MGILGIYRLPIVLLISVVLAIFMVLVLNAIFGLPLGILFFFLGINGFYVQIGLGFLIFLVLFMAFRKRRK